MQDAVMADVADACGEFICSKVGANLSERKFRTFVIKYMESNLGPVAGF